VTQAGKTDRAKLPADIVLATHRIRSYVRETPLDYSPFFSELSGAEVWLKLENLQQAGSFKQRGAFNKLLTMSDEERARGVVTASSGNHGAAVAYAMKKLGVNGIVFVPEHTSSSKLDLIRRAGAEVRFHGTDGLDTETFAREFASENDMSYLSPYNDAAVVAGQGSCGVEIARQLPSVDAVFVAVGGGGLISGIAAFLKSVRPGVRIVSCQPAASAVMTESIRAGHIVDMPSDKTLSDGTAGGIEPGAVTFDLCRELVDDFAVVSEEEIAEAMRGFIDSHHQLPEGAAGVALAGLLAKKDSVAGMQVVVVICGGNVSRETLKSVI
jgi:threonine dehydratase